MDIEILVFHPGRQGFFVSKDDGPVIKERGWTMKEIVSLQEAQGILLSHCQQVGTEEVELHDALGRVLSEDLKAGENIPPFARSPYDGYAFRAADTAMATREQPVLLSVIEEVPAGYAPQAKVGPGEAVKVLTGAPIPEGADAVEKYEVTTLKGNQVAIYSGFEPGTNVIPAGEDVMAGELIGSRGMEISPPLIGLMASLGITRVPVYQQPTIAIISTGDELLEIDEPLQPGKIRNSNSHTLAAYCRQMGAKPVILKTPKDKRDEVGAAIQQGLNQADMVITTGGVSVGDYDVVKDAVRYINGEILYWKLNFKPSSMVAAVKDGKVILSLSGNPAAALMIFQLLGMVFIRKLMGRTDYELPEMQVTLINDFKKPSPAGRFLRGRLTYREGNTFMELTGVQANGILSSMIGCNILAEIPAGSGPIPAGSKLKAYFIG